MSSTTIDARHEDDPSTNEEQQTLLSNVHPPSDMGSEIVKPEGRQGDSPAHTIVWAAYAVFALTTWTIVLSNNPASLGWFKYHPLLQSLAIGFFTYGVLTLQPTSQPPTKAAGLERHKLAMALGVSTIILGGLAMILNKASHDAPHFTSTHGKLGFITVSWLVAQAVFGGTTVWFGGALWGGGMRPKLMWKYHRLSGYFLFPVLLFTAYLGGGRSAWVSSHSDSFVQLLAYPVALFVILVGVFTRIRTSKMKFF